MKKNNKTLKIIENPFIQGIAGWITTFTTIVVIFKYGYSLMINYPIYFIIFIITGFLVMPTVYSIHTYYFQKKEIKNLKINLHYSLANIYYHLAAINRHDPYLHFIYVHQTLKGLAEIGNKGEIRQLLNKMIPIIKKIECNKISTEIVSGLNETLSKLDQKIFKTEINQINETIKNKTT